MAFGGICGVLRRALYQGLRAEKLQSFLGRTSQVAALKELGGTPDR